MKYYLIAGEASGDLHASRLMTELQNADPQAQFRYYGGDAMQAVGGDLVCHYSQLAYMGFVQVVAHLPQILGGMRRCKRDIAAFAPDVVILVDYPGFNLSIAKWVKRHLSAKVVYYISPKIWAWKEYRLRDIRRYVDRMLCILPFEVDYYRRHDYAVTYVGNPTVDELAPLLSSPFDRDAFMQRNGLDAARPVVALLAGSRRDEVRSNLSVMVQAAARLGGQYQIVLAGAPGLSEAFYAPILQRLSSVAPVRLVFGQTYDVVRAAEVAAVTSGTATLETAYLRTPQVVCYYFKGGKVFYRIMQWALRRIRYVSLVNLLLDAPAVTELLGPYLTADRLHSELQSLLEGSPRRVRMMAEYDRMHRVLGEPGAPVRAARSIMQLLGA